MQTVLMTQTMLINQSRTLIVTNLSDVKVIDRHTSIAPWLFCNFDSSILYVFAPLWIDISI